MKVGDSPNYIVIGTDNNAPYRVFYDVGALPAGTDLTFKVIVNDVLQDAAQPVNFIVHKPIGDSVPDTRAPGGDRSFTPSQTPQIWLKQGDPTVYTSQATAQGFVTVHYKRGAGDYADWGLHLWGDAIADGVGTDWAAPRQRDGIDDYGAFYSIPLKDVGQPVNFIMHKPSGDTVPDTREPGGDRNFLPQATPEIWLVQGNATVYTSRSAAVGIADRVRMQNLGISIVTLSQGIPFLQAGQDLLRSKSLDRNSYNSGDWFNKLDFTYNSNNWGVGLPPQADNQGNWPIMQPLLDNPALKPARAVILSTAEHYREMLRIRNSSPLSGCAPAPRSRPGCDS